VPESEPVDELYRSAIAAKLKQATSKADPTTASTFDMFSTYFGNKALTLKEIAEGRGSLATHY